MSYVFPLIQMKLQIKSFNPWYLSILKYIPTTYIYILINKIPQLCGTKIPLYKTKEIHGDLPDFH